MKTWLWPLSWYYRIKELELHVELLKIKNKELDAAMRAEAISHTAMTATYVSMMNSMAADYERQYSQMRQAYESEVLHNNRLARLGDRLTLSADV